MRLSLPSEKTCDSLLSICQVSEAVKSLSTGASTSKSLVEVQEMSEISQDGPFGSGSFTGHNNGTKWCKSFCALRMFDGRSVRMFDITLMK